MTEKETKVLYSKGEIYYLIFLYILIILSLLWLPELNHHSTTDVQEIKEYYSHLYQQNIPIPETHWQSVAVGIILLSMALLIVLNATKK